MRRSICVLLVIMLLMPTVVLAQGQPEMAMVEKMAAVEKVLYGAVQNGSLVDRAAKLERDMYGRETNDALQSKIERLYNRARDNSMTGASLLTELNAVEWGLTRAVTIQPAAVRIANLEKLMWGNSAAGALESRLNKLLKLAYASGRIETVAARLDKDTLVKVKITLAIDTKISRPGDAIGFEVADDVYAGDVLIVAKGARGVGKVIKAQPAKNFGRDAKLEVTFGSVEALDGAAIPTVLGEKAKEKTASIAKAAGAAAAGAVLLGPVGLIGGAFIKGQDIVIPAGAELYIQVAADTNGCGVKVR
ncbi:MAG: hypothetical protein H6Q73_1757 [Firmicutes bacterium]|nr:hypothetical protein [Bacillota bacterium]